MVIWNFYQTVPVYFVILLGSKTTEKAQNMAPIIGKLINSCDDHKASSQIFSKASIFSFFLHFLVEIVFNAIAKLLTCY